MKKFALFFLICSVFLASYAQTYKIVPENSEMSWLGEKVTGEHFGSIRIKSGEFTLKDNKLTSGKFVIDMTSITVEDITDEAKNQRLTNHLKSDDFFSSIKFPEAYFEITESGDFTKGSALVKGKLTIKGIVHPIEFKATLQQKEEGLKIYANVVIDRTKYDVKYGSGSFFDDLGDKTIYDEFKLKLNLLAKK